MDSCFTMAAIERNSLEDAGEYECEASNSVGTANYSCTVIVESKGECFLKITQFQLGVRSIHWYLYQRKVSTEEIQCDYGFLNRGLMADLLVTE